ncbi:MAG: hypothetical protein VBE63_24620 [Lamprobacter sp.]|uniref:hypothetical protein n=1 Tax=Lamprobacter sp. TaxID=3100796 RepID=UPI002B25F8BA|nr:hypothetical protein [Lamprobacter sp.]MEA3643098.1 hypothetical protein [Lamprobacter sp.]
MTFRSEPQPASRRRQRRATACGLRRRAALLRGCARRAEDPVPTLTRQRAQRFARRARRLEQEV